MPLHEAARKCHDSVVQQLLAAKAAVDVGNKHGREPSLWGQRAAEQVKVVLRGGVHRLLRDLLRST